MSQCKDPLKLRRARRAVLVALTKKPGQDFGVHEMEMVRTYTSYYMKLSIKVDYAARASAIMKSHGWTSSRMTFVCSAGKTVSGLDRKSVV